MTAAVGAAAPAFTLKDQDNQEVSLSDLAGKKALVVFIPFPFTGNCDSEACSIRDNLASLSALDAEVVLITTSPRPVTKRWSEEYGLGLRVLTDFWPHGVVSQAYGVFNDALGCAMRSTFVLDADGIVRDVIAVETLQEKREFTAYAEALAAI